MHSFAHLGFMTCRLSNPDWHHRNLDYCRKVTDSNDSQFAVRGKRLEVNALSILINHDHIHSGRCEHEVRIKFQGFAMYFFIVTCVVGSIGARTTSGVHVEHTRNF